MTHKYKGFHKKPSMEEISAKFKKDGYYKHFTCKTCNEPSVRLISTKAEATVTNCVLCSDGAHRKKQCAYEKV